MATERDDSIPNATAPTRAEGRGEVRTVDVDPVVRASSSLGNTRFELREELGKGGMGRVVAAADAWLGRTVAIKQALGDDAAGLARFEREARITARLEHAAIVPIYDGGRDAQGRPYYVMRKIAGETLADRISRSEALSQRLALVPSLLAAVDAAAFAHSHRIIHRDIKPWNILLGDYGETLLIDWGLARELGGDDVAGDDRVSIPNLTVAGRSMGTPGYMSPEQARGQPVDERTDVYALGATLWHLLGGQPVLAGSDASAWLKQVLEREVPLGPLAEEVPVELRAIVAKATAPEAERYRNAGELAHDLRAFLDGRLVAAHVYTTRQLFARWIRRHRAAVIAIAAAVITIVAITAYAFDQIIGERDEARAARAAAIDTNARINLTRAEQFVARDPASALATLRQIPADSPYLAKARDLAAVAAANGVGRGIAAHTGSVVVVAVSRDGEWIASVGTDNTIQIHAVATGSSRVVDRAAVPAALQLAWTDDSSTLLVSQPAQRHWVTKAIDIRTDTFRVLPGVNVTPVGGDRVRYVDLDTHQLVEVALSAVTTKVIADGVEFAAVDGDVAVIDGTSGLRLVDERGVRPVALKRGPVIDTGAVSRARGKAAIWLEHEVVELDLATASVGWRSKRSRGGALVYADDNLWIYDYADSSVTTPGGMSAFNASLIRPPIAGGSGLVGLTTNTVAVRHGAHVAIMQREVTAVAAHRASPLLVVGTRSGVIEWWTPPAARQYPMPADSQLCKGSGERLIGLQRHTVVFEIDRATGTTRHLATVDPAIFCFQVKGIVLVPTAETAIGPDGRRVIRFSTDSDFQSTTQLVFEDGSVVRTRAEVFFDVPGALSLAPDRKSLVGLKTDVPVLATDATMTRIWTTNGWIIALLEDGRLIRRSPSGVVDTLPFRMSPSAARVTSDGTLWLGIGNVLWRWSGGPLVPAAVLGAPITRVIGDGRIVVLADHTLWTLDGVRPVMLASELGEYQLDERVLVAHRMTSFEVVRLATRVASMLIVDPHAPSHVLVDEHTQVFGIQYAPPVAVVYQDPVPRDPAELHRWIDATTNARMSPDGETLEWR